MKLKKYLWLLLFESLLFSLSPLHLLAKNLPALGNSFQRLNNSTIQFMPGQIYVKFKPQVLTSNFAQTGNTITGIASFDNKLLKNGITKIERAFRQSPKMNQSDFFGISRIYTFYFSQIKDVIAVAEDFSRSELVEYAEPIPIYYLDNEPNDPLLNQQDHLKQIKAVNAWDLAKGDSSVIIAMIDNGTDWQHADLVDNIWTNEAEINGLARVDDDLNGYVDDFHGWDFANNDNNPTNQPANLYAYEHGTVTAGLASARTNNRLDIAGVAWNCTIMPLKHGMDDTENAIYKWEQGIKYAVDNGAAIINLSFGGFYPPFKADQDIINYAYENGVLIVASAGNVLTSEKHYPSSYNHVLSVTWVYNNDKMTDYSTYGEAVDVAAPGVQLLSLLPGNGTTRMSGSSSATPVVSGLAGLIKSQHRDWGPAQIARQIVLTADNIDAINPSFAGEMGNGRINAFRAVSEINPAEISPRIKTLSIAISDSPSGDGDWLFERGKTIQVKVFEMHNYSVSPGKNVRISLTTDDTDLTIIDGSYQLGFFAADTSIILNKIFLFSVNDNAKGKTATVRVEWQADGGFSGADSYQVIIGKLPLLLVDDDRDDYPAEKLYTTIFDSWQTNYALWDRRERGKLRPEQLANFATVVWLCEWSFPSLDSDDRFALSHFLDDGGSLFISGQDIGWDLADKSDAGNNQYSDSSLAFFHNYLHAHYFADDSDVNQVIGFPNDALGNKLQFQVYQPGLPAENQYPEEIEPTRGATSSFEYVGGRHHKFGIKYNGDYKVVYFGMGFEAIDANENTEPDELSPIRNTIMSRVLNYLNFIDASPVVGGENIFEAKNVTVKIKGQIPREDITAVYLFWKKESEAEFSKIAMTFNGANNFSATIPAPGHATTIQYYFVLDNSFYEWKNPYEAPDDYFSYYLGPDTVAPIFSHTPLPSTINGEEARSLIVGIQDNNQIDANKTYVHFYTNSFSDSAALQSGSNPEQFTGIIPASFSYGDTVFYYFSAYDKASKPNRGFSETYFYIVGLEDFESGLGNWFTTPNGWGLDDLYAHSGNQAINDSPGQAPYPSNRWAIIMSLNSFDLSHCESASLSFWTKYYIELNSDYGYVEASKNNGATWKIIGQVFNGYRSIYHKVTLSLNDFCGSGNTKVKIRFRFVSDAQTIPPIPGWFIDDIQIRENDDVSEVAEAAVTSVPKSYRLYQNFPNPFNLHTTISFDLPAPEQVNLSIFNIKGEVVQTLVEKQLNAGIHRFEWDGTDKFHLPLASGMYFYRLESEKYSSVKKLLLLK